ncbi:hypothetical protein FRB90_001240 [Tulasnella sp. 427]|nr:hypothetical protein FRB90_001240 [Tulasnella sp. 427]
MVRNHDRGRGSQPQHPTAGSSSNGARSRFQLPPTPSYNKFNSTRASTAAATAGTSSSSRRHRRPPAAAHPRNTKALRDVQVPELLHLIFTYLPKPSLAACARVNRSWFPIVIEHLWRSVNVRTFLKLSSGYRRVADLVSLGPVCSIDFFILSANTLNIAYRKLYAFFALQIQDDLSLTVAEVARLGIYAPCIAVFEFSYHEATGNGAQRPPDLYIELLIDLWCDILNDHPHLLPIPHGGFTHPITDLTLPVLFPRLRSLLGSTSHNFAEGCQNAEFLVPFRPLHGLLRPLTKVYRTEPLALSLVATTSSEVVMDTSDLRPSIWFEFKRNPILRRVEFTRRSRRVVRDDWDKVLADAPGAGWTKQTFPWHLKPPIRHLTLRAFDVHFVFTRLVDKRMFGPVTQIRVLRLRNFSKTARQYESTESRSSRSEYLPRLVDTEDELAEETGSEVAPWEGKTLKDGGDAIVDDQDVAVTSTLLETASFDDDDGVSYFDGTPITAANIRTVLGDRSTRPTPLTEAALAEMRASSRDVDLASSRNSSTTRSSQSPPPPPPGFETDDYPDLDASSAASGLGRRSDASSSRLAGPLYNTESSTDDDDDASGGAGAGGGGSLWNPLGFNFFNDNYTSEDDSASDDSFASVSSDALQGGAHPPIDPPDRAFLRLVAESCPELEMLVLEEAWDFDRLTAEEAGGAGASASVAVGTRAGEPEGGPGTLSRVRLRVNFRSVEDVEERTEVLMKGIRRAMKQKTVNTKRPKFSRGFFLKPR